MDEAGFALDFFALASKFVKGDAVFFDSGNHRWGLVEVAAEGGEGGFDLVVGVIGDWAFFEDGAVGVLGIGDLAEAEGADVFLVFAHEEVLDFGAAADGEEEEAGGEGVEGAAVADFFGFEDAAAESDDVVGGHAWGFVNS